MREMAAVREIETHNSVMCIQESGVGIEIGRGTGQSFNVLAEVPDIPVWHTYVVR